MGAAALFSPARLDRQHPGPQPDGPGADRVDRLRGRDRAGPEGRRDRVGPARSPTRSSRARTSRRTSRSSLSRASARSSSSCCRSPPISPRGPTRRSSATWPAASAAGSATSRRWPSRATWRRFMRAIRMQTEPKRTAVFVHVASPERGLAVQGQELPNLPGSVRAVFASKKEIPVQRDPLRPGRRRPPPPGSSRAPTRSGSRWPRTPGSRYR